MSIPYQQVLDFFSTSPYFSQLDESDRHRLVREFDLISLVPGQVLFLQNEPADAFFVVLEGRLKLTREKNRRMISETIVQKGDPIGEEAFVPAESYRATATAAGDVILLRTRGDRVKGLVDQYPRLAGCRNLLSGMTQLSRLANLDWFGRDERLVILTRRSHFFLIARTFAPAIFVLIGLVIMILNLRGVITFSQPVATGVAVFMAAALLWILWVAIDWANDYYILTSRRLVRVDRKAGVFDRRDEVPLGNIMTVEMTTSALGKMFAFADITSRTYNTPVVWHGIGNPEMCVSLIQLWIERVKSNQDEIEIAEMQAALDRRMRSDREDSADHPIDEQMNAIDQAPPITFRKHWVILLRKTWFQLVFGVTGLYVLLGGLSKYLPAPLSVPVKWVIGITVVFLLIWYFYQFMDWSNDIYQVTSEQILDVKRTPLGREERKTAMLENILSINYRRRGLAGVLLNYGTVNIQVGTESLIFDFVRDPSGVQREIFRRMAERQEALRRVQIDSERERMSQWITAYHRRVND